MVKALNKKKETDNQFPLCVGHLGLEICLVETHRLRVYNQLSWCKTIKRRR